MFGRKTRFSRNSKSREIVNRMYFCVEGVEMYFDFSDIADLITEEDSSEDVIRKIDAYYGTDFWDNVFDDAMVCWEMPLDEVNPASDNPPRVYSYSEAVALEAAMPRVYIERKGTVAKIYMEKSTGDARKDLKRHDNRTGTDFSWHVDHGEARIIRESEIGDRRVHEVKSWGQLVDISDWCARRH